jgi:4-hydroxybenzoate polyprenyltransferase
VTSAFTSLRELVKWDEWYSDKLAFVLAALYYGTLLREHPGSAELVDVVWLLGAVCMLASFGYLVNDFSDRSADRLVGKKNVLANMNGIATAFVVILPMIATVALAASRFSSSLVMLSALSCAVAATYSLEPIRLKERGIWGWGAAAVGQRALPAMLAFHAFGVLGSPTAQWFCALSTAIGLCYIVAHQIDDLENDLLAGIRTPATLWGRQRLRGLLSHAILPIELVCFCVTMGLFGRRFPVLGLVAVGYALLIWWRWNRATRPLQWWFVAQYLFTYTNQFCMVYLPLTLSGLLAFQDPVFAPVVAVTCLWQWRHLRDDAHDVSGLFGRRQTGAN